MIRLLIIGFVLLITLAGCQNDVLVSKTWEWKDHQWVGSDHKSITLEAVDTTSVYSMELSINHQKSYGYQNLYIQTLTTFPSGREVPSVTSLELTDKYGSWTGDCSGNACKIVLPLQQGFTFPEMGTYRWSVEPYMRIDTIPGINSLTITCRKVKV